MICAKNPSIDAVQTRKFAQIPPPHFGPFEIFILKSPPKNKAQTLFFLKKNRSGKNRCRNVFGEGGGGLDVGGQKVK